MATTTPKDKKSKPFHSEGTREREIVDAVMEFKHESKQRKLSRMTQNRINWDLYHGRNQVTPKRKGQSNNFLHKSSLAVEQISALFKQSLTNFDKWIGVEVIGNEDPIIDAVVAKILLRFYFEKANVKTVLADGIKVGLNESLVTLKLTGEMKTMPRFIANGREARRLKKGKEKKAWGLNISVVPGEDWFPDPDAQGGEPLYQDHQVIRDKYKVLARSKGPDAIYDKEIVKDLPSMTDLQSETRKARNRGDIHYVPRITRRWPFLLDEFHGTILARDGTIMEIPGADGEMVPLENIVCTIANETALIRPPVPNPRWSGTTPFVSAPILRVPFSTWSKAIMDSAGALNITLNELFNLMLDGALSAVWGVRQIREEWLDDESIKKISEGIPPGTTLSLNSTAPIDAKVLERVDTGEVPGDVLSFYNIVNSIYAESVFANELTFGALPKKQVKATEIVQASQAITGVFEGLASDFEDVFVEKLAEEAWMDILQNVDKFPKGELETLLPPGKFQALNSLSPAQRFERGARSFKWKGKGIRTISARMKDFQRLTQFLAVVGQNEQMLNEFSMRYSMPKFLGQLVRSLEIDTEEIELDENEQKLAAARRQAVDAARAGAEAEKGQGGAPPQNIPEDPGITSPAGAETGSGAGI